MSGRRHLAALALAAALAVPALSACQDEEPQPRLPEETPSSAEPTPTEAETTEAVEETPEEFLRRWQAEVDLMQSTGDGSEYRQLTRGCRACQDFADRVEKVYADGGTVISQPTQVVSVQRSGSVGEATTYDVVIQSRRLRILNSKGEEVDSFAGGRSVLRAEVLPDDGGWRLRNYTTVVTS